MTRGVLFGLLFSCGVALGQSPAPAAFETAAIHVHAGPLHSIMDFSASGPRLKLGGYTRRQLVLEAYGLKPYQLRWAETGGGHDNTFYDIVATAAGDISPDRQQFRLMLQTMLRSRFNLELHAGTQQLAVYALTVAKGGAKLKASTPGGSDRGLFGVHGRNQTIDMPRESMESLAEDIANVFMVDRPVIDRTGLPGDYNVTLEATPQPRIEDHPQPEDLSVFTAVQEQLGLKLEPCTAPVQVYVIDRMDQPSEN